MSKLQRSARPIQLKRSARPIQLKRRGVRVLGFRWLLATLGSLLASGIIITFSHGDAVTSSIDETLPNWRLQPKKQAFFPAPEKPAIDTSTIERSPSTGPDASAIASHHVSSMPEPSSPPPDRPESSKNAGDTTTPTSDTRDQSTPPSHDRPIEPEAKARPSNNSLPTTDSGTAGPTADLGTAGDTPPSPANPGIAEESLPGTDGPRSLPDDQPANSDSPRLGASGGPNQGSARNNEGLEDPGLTTSTTKPVRFAKCDDAYDAGVAPILAGQPGYERRLDGDADGIACDIDLRL